MHLTPGMQVDRWTVDAHVADGGMARVYRVRHAHLGSLHALKVLHPHFAASDDKEAAGSLQARLLEEGRAQSSLVHPHIVSVTDVVRIRGQLGLIMEWVDGPSLAEWLRVARPSPDQIDVLGRGLLRGLAAAHEAGWVHRDLKPGNVLLQITGEGLLPKITDFGLAKQLHQGAGNRTATGHAFGTPSYMAPEQIRDASGVDARADLFSLGAILYELCAGQRAFPGANPLSIFSAIGEGRFEPLESAAPGLPPRFYAAVADSLEVDRDRRVPSAVALLETWTREGADIVSEPVGPWGRDDLDRARELVDDEDGLRTWGPTPAEDVLRSRPSSDRPRDTLVPPLSTLWRQVIGGGVILVVLMIGWWVTRRPLIPLPPTVSEREGVQRRFELGWEQWADARFSSAIRTLRAVAQDEPDEPYVHLMLAASHYALGSWESGLKTLVKAEASLQKDDDDPAIAPLIAALRESVATAETDVWDELASQFPRHGLVQVLSCLHAPSDSALALCERARLVDDMAAIDWRLADLALVAWDLDEAEAHLGAFLTRSPEHPEGLVMKSIWHAGKGEWPDAEAAARRALDLDSQLIYARRWLSVALAHQGDDAGRRAEMARALSDAYPVNERIQALYDDSLASLGLGQYDRALSALNEAERLTREAELWHHIGLVHTWRAQLGWFLDDPELIAANKAGLQEAAAAPEIPEELAQGTRVSLVYMEGLEATLRQDGPAVERARDRLRGLPRGWVSWVPYDAAVAVLDAWTDRLQRGDSTKLLTIATTWPGCEIDVRGGELLLSEGLDEEGLRRLHRATEDCVDWGVGRHFKYRAHRLLAQDADRRGDPAAAREHRRAMADLHLENDLMH